MPIPALPNTVDNTHPSSVDQLNDQVVNLLFVVDYMADYVRDMLKAVSYDEDVGGLIYDSSLLSIDEEFLSITKALSSIRADLDASM